MLPASADSTYAVALHNATDAPLTRFAMTALDEDVAIGVKKANFELMGVRILVDPVFVRRLAPSMSSTVPLPIPNQPALIGTRVFLQGVHVEPSGWAATRGLDLSIR